MKTKSPIFRDSKDRISTLALAAVITLFLALISLIAVKAFASTEAEPPETDTIELKDGTKVIIEKAGAYPLAVIKPEPHFIVKLNNGEKIVAVSKAEAEALVETLLSDDQGKELRCRIEAIAHFGNMTKTTHKRFKMPVEDATVLSTKLKAIAARAKAGGNDGVSISCFAGTNPADPDYEYSFTN
ncbi:MAG: hypothetical protein AB1325_14070 [Nitrospirota bacterium]